MHNRVSRDRETSRSSPHLSSETRWRPHDGHRRVGEATKKDFADPYHSRRQTYSPSPHDVPDRLSSRRRGGHASNHAPSAKSRPDPRQRPPSVANTALSDADINIIDHVPDRIPNRIVATAKPQRVSRRTKRDYRDHAIRLLKNPRATLTILGATQQGIRLFQKFRPGYSGGMHFHAGNVASFISRYRMFHNVADWLSVYAMIKEQMAAGLRNDKTATIAGWGATLGYMGYLITEFLCFAGLTETFKLSKVPATNARRCDDYDRRSAQAFGFWIITKGIQHAREHILDKRQRRERALRVPISELTGPERVARLADDANFEKELKLRRAKRKRFLVINGAWAPAALHWGLKNSFMSKKTGPAFAVLAQMCKTYYFWGDARMA